MRIDYAISTVDRSTQYIHQTLEYLGKGFRANLVVGSPESSYLDRYRGHHGIIETPVSEWDKIKDADVGQRAAWNYLRCLTMVSSEDSKGILILEDDVKPMNNWQDRFSRTLKEAEEKLGDGFILSLYCPHSLPMHIALAGGHCAGYPAQAFYGTQAMYFPNTVRILVSEAIKTYSVDSFKMPYDISIKVLAHALKIPMVASIPSIFQHVGYSTSGLGNFHSAPNFYEEF